MHITHIDIEKMSIKQSFIYWKCVDAIARSSTVCVLQVPYNWSMLFLWGWRTLLNLLGFGDWFVILLYVNAFHGRICGNISPIPCDIACFCLNHITSRLTHRSNKHTWFSHVFVFVRRQTSLQWSSSRTLVLIAFYTAFGKVFDSAWKLFFRRQF